MDVLTYENRADTRRRRRRPPGERMDWRLFVAFFAGLFAITLAGLAGVVFRSPTAAYVIYPTIVLLGLMFSITAAALDRRKLQSMQRGSGVIISFFWVLLGVLCAGAIRFWS